MANQIPRLFTRHICQPSAPFSRTSNSIPRVLRAPLRNAPVRRSYATGESGPRPKPGKNTITIWPFVAITLAGSGAYALMVKSRADAAMAPTDKPQLPAPKKDTPTFSPSNVTVLFVLGGPGAGKGTQCANLVRDYNFTHLSAGDLLRAEQERPGSEFGDLIKSYIKDGLIVPMEVTVQLLENAMHDTISKSADGKTGKFLIDGFPRKMDQALAFEKSVCESRFVLFFDCPEEEMMKRLMERGKTSGRADDNVESIRKRFRTFVETSMPVVEYFEGQGRVVRVLATKSKDEVYKEVKEKVEGRLGEVVKA